jgi:hypothetical protein
MPPRFEVQSRDLGNFRKDRTAVHRRTAPGLRAEPMPALVMMLPDQSIVLAWKGASRRSHAKRIRCHQESDDQKLGVAEYAPKSHSVGFPFRHRTVSQQQCSKVSMICGGLAFWQPRDEKPLTVGG